ncbi:transcription elongation factor GreB [Anaerobiospirillum sp. NML120448]|nr:transcription elongation factor GreB [Anaerobiospirillum sp. NML120448]
MAKKPYITAQGYELLKKELDYLWLEKRPDVTAKVSWAASLGDRSENADYQYNKRLLAQIDRRIRYLRKVLNDLQVVEFNSQQEGRVFFGAYVEIEADDDESIMQIRIVGGEEIFGRDNYISVDAPMAKALLGKSEGDDAVVHTPKGDRLWYINKIAYKNPQWFTELEPKINDHDNMNDEDDSSEYEELSADDLKKLEQSYMSTLVK